MTDTCISVYTGVDLESRTLRERCRSPSRRRNEAVHAFMSGSRARDPAVLASVRALRPDGERPAVREPLRDLLPAPNIPVTAFKNAASKMSLCSAAALDCMVIHVPGFTRSTFWDTGVGESAQALLAFLQVCPNAGSVRHAFHWLGKAYLHPQERGERRRRRVDAARRPDGSSQNCAHSALAYVLLGREGNHTYVGKGRAQGRECNSLCVNCCPGPRGGPESYLHSRASDASPAFSASRRETGEAVSLLRVETPRRIRPRK
jgi:hypothetical protein